MTTSVDLDKLTLYIHEDLDENEMLEIDALLVSDMHVRTTVQSLRTICNNPDFYINPPGGIARKIDEIGLLLKIAQTSVRQNAPAEYLKKLFRKASEGTMCIVRAAIDIKDRCVVATDSILADGSRIELPCAIGDPDNSLQKASRLLSEGQHDRAFQVLRKDDRCQSLSAIHVQADGKTKGVIDIEANGLFVNVRIWDTEHTGDAALVWNEKTLLSPFEFFDGNDFVVAHFDLQAFGIEPDFSMSPFSIIW
jgi:hypothetical protein